MITIDLNTSFEWRMTSETPRDIEEPILCLTENGKLMTFKNTKTLICPNKVETGFGNLVEKYKIKLWTYQKELLPKEIIIIPKDTIS